MLLWGILCVSVDTSTRTPYCTTVCLCLNNSLTHSPTQHVNSRRPGADRSPRSTQKRPPPANPTLPPPAPRAPPRACSKAVGEMKARAADATGTSVVQEENTCRNPVDLFSTIVL